MKTLLLGLCAAAIATPVLAQSVSPYDVRRGQPGTTTVIQNNTGGAPSVVISRGATGADTYTNNSAAGGNAGRPELAIPNGSAGGGGGGGNR